MFVFELYDMLNLLDSVKNQLDEVVDCALITRVGFLGTAVGDNHAAGHSLVTQQE